MKLNVDSILLYRTTCDQYVYVNSLKVFLINIKTKKIYAEEILLPYSVNNAIGEVSGITMVEETKVLTEKAFNNFAKNID
ncbi:MAG: hypothetical protein PVH36_05795, partial [Desulfobacterales bacterium]